MGKRNPKRGQGLKNLVFDPQERKDFLLGFRARKQDRKEKAAEKEAKKLKEEKARLRAKRKDQMAQMFTAGGLPLPEVEHLVERVEEYEMDGQTVTISTVDSYDAAREAGLCLGPNNGNKSKAMKREEKRKRREKYSE